MAAAPNADKRRQLPVLLAAGAIAAMAVNPAEAALVSACSGVSLPKSVVTDIVGQAVVPVATILDNTLGLITGPLGLSTNLSNTLASIAAGNPVTLNVLDVNGQVVNQGAPCASTADSFELTTPKGISIGGNKITGLGANTVANAGELNSIAFGNNATTSATATNSIAIGPNASIGASGVNSVALGSGSSATAANSVALGAGSTATTGAQANYTAYALTTLQNSVGEVSVGSPGNLRKITNVAPGSAATDAVNVQQLQAVDNGAVKYDNPTLKTSVTLGGIGGTTISNLAPGVAGTDAVNVNQLRTMATTPIMYFHANSTGPDSLANGAESVAIGPSSVAAATNSVAIGSGAIADRVNTISVGAPGSERQITNVADATAPTDAVNLRQLNAAVGRVDDVLRDANAGSASAMAMASMPQSAYPGRSMIAAGMATYDGQSALSIGVSKLSDNGRWVFKFGGSTNTRGNVGAGAGVGFHF